MYFLMLFSPLAWLRCFALVFVQTRARSRYMAFVHIAAIVLALLLMGGFCYLNYSLSLDGGLYLNMLSNVASDTINVTDGRNQFDSLIWQTVLKTFFMAVLVGMIQMLNIALAALWRQRICDLLQYLLLRSPNGYTLYETSRTEIGLPSALTNDVRQFTTNFGIVLFGSMFIPGVPVAFSVVAVFSNYIVQATGGDTNGILFCFVSLIFCILLLIPTMQIYNANVVKQAQAKGRIRAFIQRIQMNAECIALYGSQLLELRYFNRLLEQYHRCSLWGSMSFGLLNFPISLQSNLTSMVTYVIPSIIFFFLRSPNNQDPTTASTYLGVISFYGYLYAGIVQVIYITEPSLIAVTMGNRLWTLAQRLEQMGKATAERLEVEEKSGIKQYDVDTFGIQNLQIIVPDEIDGSKKIILQRDINIEARRGECILISGPSGCGKTSLFRTCAGLWPIDAERVQLPQRHNLIFIPQRPYLPIGSLRFQALFLLESRFPENKSGISIVSDGLIRTLFEYVNLDYLLDRYGLDRVVDWSTVLSIGEQQRLSFVRLFTLFTHAPASVDIVRQSLILLDESTSAIDALTETQIYERMVQLNIWFLTITHRASLIHFHNRELKLANNRMLLQRKLSIISTSSGASLQGIDTIVNPNGNEQSQDNEDNEHIIEEQKDEKIYDSAMDPDMVDNNRSWLQNIIEIFKVIHLPFDPNDRYLRLQTYGFWLWSLLIIGLTSYTVYRWILTTVAIFSPLSDYAAEVITITAAKDQIRSQLPSYVLLLVWTATGWALTVGPGQTLAALYTRRQSAYIARLVFGRQQYVDNTLYHTRRITALANLLSHDLAEINSQLCYFLFGHIYYSGVIAIWLGYIPVAVLLSNQTGGGTSVLVIYVTQFGLSICVLLSSALYKTFNVKFESAYVLFDNAQKRIDLQAEPIALSDRGVVDVEAADLRMKLDTSVRHQIRSGIFYGVICFFAEISFFSGTIINYALPAAIFFHTWFDQGEATPTNAGIILLLTVYSGSLQSQMQNINYHGQAISQVWSIGSRAVATLEQLRRINERHRQWEAAELSEGRRTNTSGNNDGEPTLELKNVDIHIPRSPHVLVPHVNILLDSQDTLLICGQSGCGKSTFLRLLAGLNQNERCGSSLKILPRRNLIFICQRLHLIEGTLREQLSYLRETNGLGPFTDEVQARQLLDRVSLTHLIERYGFDGDCQIWDRLLSVGEQQRLMIVAALLARQETTHRCLVLDEATSACDRQTETAIYEYLQNSRIQYISISHRHELIKYHSYLMTIDSKNHTYSITTITNCVRL